MTRLVIEYILQGHRRGYNFTSPTHGFDEAVLRQIWRCAMPRGQGWGAYIGAQSLKSFLLDDGRVAVAEVAVTDLRDENGRAGIRRAVIDALSQQDYLAHLDQRLLSYPSYIRARVDQMPTFLQRAKIANQARFGSHQQLVLAYPYAGPDAWQMIEAFVIRLALSPVGPLRRRGPVIPLTTLALDYREESTLVALPQQRARQLPTQKVSIIEL
jgi:hypothetical protein